MHSQTILLVILAYIKCASPLIIEEDQYIPPVTFQNVRISLISQRLKTKNTLYVQSGENLRDFVIGNQIDTIRINDQIIPTLYEKSVTDIKNVAIIDLSSNQIQGIEEDAFGNLGLVQALNLSSNLIRVVRSEVFTNIDAKFIFLAHNRIFKIEDGAFRELQQLHYIDLSYNRIRSWNSNWFKGTAVKGINMRHNSLEILAEDSFKFLDDLEVPDNQRILHHLLFDHNEIRRIHRLCLPRLKKLNVFDLSYNYLETIEDGTFDEVDSLDRLDLSYNMLVYLDKNLFRHTTIGYVNLKSNYLFIVSTELAPLINLDLNPLDRRSKKEWNEWKKVKGHLLESLEYL